MPRSASKSRNEEIGGTRLLIWMLLLGLFVTVPHVTEDFVYGVPRKYGLSVPLAGFLLAVGYFVQFYGLTLLMRGRRAGVWISLLIGAGWLAGALWDHLLDLFTSDYREGMISKLWVIGLIFWSASLVFTGLFSLYAKRR